MVCKLFNQINPYYYVKSWWVDIGKYDILFFNYVVFLVFFKRANIVSSFIDICGYICLIWVLRFIFHNSEGNGMLDRSVLMDYPLFHRNRSILYSTITFMFGHYELFEVCNYKFGIALICLRNILFYIPTSLIILFAIL